MCLQGVSWKVIADDGRDTNNDDLYSICILVDARLLDEAIRVKLEVCLEALVAFGSGTAFTGSGRFFIRQNCNAMMI